MSRLLPLLVLLALPLAAQQLYPLDINQDAPRIARRLRRLGVNLRARYASNDDLRAVWGPSTTEGPDILPSTWRPLEIHATAAPSGAPPVILKKTGFSTTAQQPYVAGVEIRADPSDDLDATREFNSPLLPVTGTQLGFGGLMLLDGSGNRLSAIPVDTTETGHRFQIGGAPWYELCSPRRQSGVAGTSGLPTTTKPLSIEQ